MPHRTWPDILAVIFDFDGTLTDDVAADVQALGMLRERACPHVEAGRFIETAVDEIMAFHDRVERGQADPLSMDRARLRGTFFACGVPWDDAHLAIYTAALLSATRPAPGALELLADLRGRCRLGLLTNAYDGPAQRRRLNACGLTHHFDAVVVAGEVGHLKPHPRPFEVTLEQLGVAPHQAVYVGDSPKHDVEGAAAVGLRTVLISRRTHPGADLCVPDLKALRDLWRR